MRTNRFDIYVRNRRGERIEIRVLAKAVDCIVMVRWAVYLSGPVRAVN